MYPLTKPVLNLMSSQNWKPQQKLYLSLCLFYLAGWTWCTKGIWSLISLMKLRNWSCKDCKIFIRITHIRRLCCACVSNWQLHAYTAVEMFRNNSCSSFSSAIFSSLRKLLEDISYNISFSQPRGDKFDGCLDV